MSKIDELIDELKLAKAPIVEINEEETELIIQALEDAKANEGKFDVISYMGHGEVVMDDAGDKWHWSGGSLYFDEGDGWTTNTDCDLFAEVLFAGTLRPYKEPTLESQLIDGQLIKWSSLKMDGICAALCNGMKRFRLG